jgi:hypothetical protein
MHEIQSVQTFCGVFDESAFCFDERLVSCYEKRVAINLFSTVRCCF